MDYLDILEKYKDIKEVSELSKEIRELREYYNSQQFDKMQQHINKLTGKYLVDTIVWNSVNKNMPTTYQQAYKNAECFLRTEGSKILLKNGINALENISNETGIF